MTRFVKYKRESQSPKPPNEQGVPRMSTFNFAEAIKTAKTEDEFWKLAVKHGASITPPCPPSYSGYAFVNLGGLEGPDAFIAKGVLGRFTTCTYGDAFCDFDMDEIERMAFTGLFRAHEAFQEFDGSCINVSEASTLTFSGFFNLLWENMSGDCVRIGSYTRDMEKVSEIAEELNMSTDEVAVWCGMDACFAASSGGDDFLAEDEDAERHLCDDYTQGIVMWFETKKRKRDDSEEDE